MIEEPIKYIKKVEISGLWGRYDIEWNLHPDVNVLAGINGSGKSTILDCISNLLSKAEIPDFRLGLVEKVTLTFDNQKHLFYEYLKIKDTIRNIEKKAKEGDSRSKKIILDLKNKEKDSYKNIHSIEIDAHETSLEELKVTPDSLDKLINTNLVSTFDLELKTSEAVQKLSNNQVRTELDWELSQLQTKYLEYKLDVVRKLTTIMESSPENYKSAFDKVRTPHLRFLEIINELFSETNKKINSEKNQLSFLLNDKEISVYRLSSGEKQLLIILLTVLVQDNKPAILLMDEPEISLHLDWQENLINYILELNPNAQLIIATHSPGIIMKGWGDKVFELSDLTVKDRLAP